MKTEDLKSVALTNLKNKSGDQIVQNILEEIQEADAISILPNEEMHKAWKQFNQFDRWNQGHEFEKIA
jgi:hypothetical protein